MAGELLSETSGRGRPLFFPETRQGEVIVGPRREEGRITPKSDRLRFGRGSLRFCFGIAKTAGGEPGTWLAQYRAHESRTYEIGS